MIYGDAANPVVLEHAHLDRAQLLAVLIPDEQTAQTVTRQARLHHPGCTSWPAPPAPATSSACVRPGRPRRSEPEFEAGVEVIRHTLRRYGVGGLELVNLIAGRRAAFYSRALEGEQA